jgi:hypothetical protein
MVGLIAFVRPDSCVMGEEVYSRNIMTTYQTFGTETNPATLTKSMGLPSDALAVKFFAAQFTRYTLTDNFVPSTVTCKKLASPDADGN